MNFVQPVARIIVYLFIIMCLMLFWLHCYSSEKKKLRFLPSLFGPGGRGRGSLTISNLNMQQISGGE